MDTRTPAGDADSKARYSASTQSASSNADSLFPPGVWALGIALIQQLQKLIHSAVLGNLQLPHVIPHHYRPLTAIAEALFGRAIAPHLKRRQHAHLCIHNQPDISCMDRLRQYQFCGTGRKISKHQGGGEGLPIHRRQNAALHQIIEVIPVAIIRKNQLCDGLYAPHIQLHILAL